MEREGEKLGERERARGRIGAMNVE